MLHRVLKGNANYCIEVRGIRDPNIELDVVVKTAYEGLEATLVGFSDLNFNMQNLTRKGHNEGTVLLEPFPVVLQTL